MFVSLLVASALATEPASEPPPTHEPRAVQERRRVEPRVVGATFGGAVLGTATGLTLSAVFASGEMAGIGTPALTFAGAAIPATLMTDARAGYVSLGTGIGMASGFVAGVSLGAGIGAASTPSDGFSALIGAGIGGIILGSLGAATGALVAAGLDIKGQDRRQWGVAPTYDLRQESVGIVFSGRF